MAKGPNLPDVALVAVSSVALEATVTAMLRSMQQLQFGAVKLFTDRPPPCGVGSQIEIVPVAPLASREAYSRFLLTQLANYIDTRHVLIVQWDGFVLDGSRWDERFLDFDYIGAPWPQFRDGRDVGNGGFSLRSRRLLGALANLAPDTQEAEDVVIGRVLRRRLEELGIQFADRETAARFSFERTRQRGAELGFHGSFNLPGLVSAPELAQLLRQVEPELINARDLRAMLIKCVASGDLGNALRLLKRLVH